MNFCSKRCGIFCNVPKSCPYHTYRESRTLGTIRISDVELLVLLLGLAEGCS